MSYGNSLIWLVVIVLTGWVTRIPEVEATSAVDVNTLEQHQISIETGSGVRPTVGWTLTEEGGINITVAIRKINLGWLAVGVSSSDGLGSSLMFGNKGGGAIIVRPPIVSTDKVKEYSLLGDTPTNVVPYDANPVSVLDVQKCVSDFCVTQASVCLGQKLCSAALQCGQAKYAALTGGNTTLNSSSSVSSTVAFISECAAPLSNPKDPDQVSALAALLDAGGCVVSSCTKKILDKGLKEPSLNSSEFSEDATTSTLRFSLSKLEIAGIPLNLQTTTFLVAYANHQPANLLLAHTPDQRGFASVNLETAEVSREPSPSWLTSHIATTVLGFGLFFPVSIILRSVALHRYTWLPLVSLALALTLGSVGAVIVSSQFEGHEDYSDPHAILGILSILFVALYILLNTLQPIERKNSDLRAWDRVALIGIKDTQIDLDNRMEWQTTVHFTFRFLEVATVAIICATLFTGVTSVQNSAVIVDSSLMVIAIAASALCVASLISIFGIKLWCSGRCGKRAPVDAQTDNITVADSSAAAPQSAANPGFLSENIGAVDVDPALAGAGSVDVDVIPLILTWEKVSLYAKPVRSNSEPKQILKNAIGVCAPRTLTAVLGPSGAGKSSLMEILAMRARVAPSPESQVNINGTPSGRFPGIHRLMGYVPQHDVLHQYLTVLETLRFTCRLILPEEMSEQAKVDRMLRVVAQLGIGHILDTKVGGDSVRGLSGGERRRISIALQMLKSPSILFLDEPTSGLDAHLALRLVKVLRELANEGRTVFATIHQPSAACFELFDRVVLLSGGYTVYSGSRTGAMQFMKDQNREVPMNWNPADWLLTVVDFKRDERILATTEHGQTVYQTDAATEEILRKRGIVKQGKTSSGDSDGGAKRRFRVATSIKSLDLDVSELRDNIKVYYLQVNPDKLVEHPGVIEEIVTFALSKGLDALDKKLLARYKVSILPFIKTKPKKNLEPCTWEELAALITSFASSSYSFELVSRIRKAKDEARSTLAQLSPGLNAGYILERLDSTGTAITSPTSPGSNKRNRHRRNSDGEHHDDENDYAQPFMNQVRLLSRRSISLVWRNPQALKFQALQNIVFGILLGALYSDVKFLKSSPFQQSIVMAIILAMVAFVTLSLGTQVAFNDRLVLEREMSDSMYSPIAHFLQRLVIGIPVAFIIALCLIIPAYFWVGLKSDGASFFFFCLVNAAIVFLFDSVVFALTLIVSDVNSAYAIGNFYEALTIFFSGVFLPIYAMPGYFRWLYFLSPFSYAFGAVVVNEFQHTDNEFSIAISGVVIRSEWPNLLIVFAIGLIWRLFGFFGIIRLFRRKRPGSLAWHQNKERNNQVLLSPRVAKKIEDNDEKLAMAAAASPSPSSHPPQNVKV